MLGFKRRQRQQPDTGEPGSPHDTANPDRLGSTLVKLFGPPTVEGAIQGHTPEARQAWKDLVESRKRAREEARRQHAE